MSTATPGATTTVTLDTNVLIECWKDQEKAAVTQELLGLQNAGQIDLAVTTRISADIPFAPLAERINELSKLGVARIGSSFRIGVSALGGEDMLVGPEAAELDSFLEERAQARGMGTREPDWRDKDHLYGHMVAGRDVFLTWDRGILDMAEALRERGLTVMAPDVLVARLSRANDGLLA